MAQSVSLWNFFSKKFLYRLNPESGQIVKGREFQLLAQLIDDGYLPFVPQPVAPEDYRESQVNFSFEGKYQFQEEAYQKFLQLGAVGIYWMTGAGKSFFAMKALDSLQGPKLLVVPTRTLIDQWREYFRRYAPRLSREVEIAIYNTFEKLKNRQFSVILFDECHRLPANSFLTFSNSDLRASNKCSMRSFATVFALWVKMRSRDPPTQGIVETMARAHIVSTYQTLA
jgi:hypothetical protein